MHTISDKLVFAVNDPHFSGGLMRHLLTNEQYFDLSLIGLALLKKASFESSSVSGLKIPSVMRAGQNTRS